MILELGFGCIITLQSKPSSTDCLYQLNVSSFPECTCPPFKDTMSKFGRLGCLFKYCKHLYYIFVKVCGLDLELNFFIHVPTFNFNGVKLLESGILIHPIAHSFICHMSILLYQSSQHIWILTLSPLGLLVNYEIICLYRFLVILCIIAIYILPLV